MADEAKATPPSPPATSPPPTTSSTPKLHRLRFPPPIHQSSFRRREDRRTQARLGQGLLPPRRRAHGPPPTERAFSLVTSLCCQNFVKQDYVKILHFVLSILSLFSEGGNYMVETISLSVGRGGVGPCARCRGRSSPWSNRA